METTTTTTTVTVPDAEVSPPAVAELADVPALVAGLKASLEASSKDGARPTLNGVHVSANADTGHLVMVATDSYRLHELTVYPGSDVSALFRVPAILPRDELTAVIKMLSAPAFKRDRYGNSGRATVSVTWAHALGADDRAGVTYANRRTFTFGDHAMSIAVTEVPGDYPNVANLMFDPDTAMPGAAAFSPQYLAGICKAAGYVDKTNPVQVRGHRPAPIGAGRPDNYRPESSPCMFTATGDGVTMRAILMPVRLP
jgi:hypothetical protein